jgi:hypothetical protein
LRTKASVVTSHLGEYAGSREVRTVFTVDSALQHTCAIFREQAARGDITAAECDLLIDGAVLLAVNIETLIQDAHADRPPAWPEAGQRPAERVLAASGAR